MRRIETARNLAASLTGQTREQEIQSLLGQIRPLLPLQNPLSTFVHNNLLLAFEDRPFHHGAQEAAQIYGARPYCAEEFYRAALAEEDATSKTNPIEAL